MVKTPTSSVIALGSKIFKSSLFRAAGTYGFFSLLNKVIPFLLLPVMTRYLTPEDYGFTAIFGVMVTIATPFIGFSTHGAYSRAYFAPERFDSATYLGTVVFFVLTTGLAMQFLFYGFGEFLSGIFSFPEAWLWAVPVVALSSVFAQITLVSWQVRENPRPYGLFQNGRTLCEVAGALFFVVLMGMGWQGRLIPKTGVSILFACLGIFVLLRKKWILFRFNRSYLRHALCFGIPLIPHSLAGILNTTIDRLFITHMVGMADTGLYTVGYQIGSVILLLAGAFNQAFVPWLFRKLNADNPEEKVKIVRFTYLYFVVILALALGLGAFAPLLLRLLVGKQFQGSMIFVIWIALGSAFTGMYYMVVNYIFYAEKTHLLALTTFFGAGLNVLLNYFFIRANGAIGAAQATSLAHVIVFIFVWYLSSRVYTMPWREGLFKSAKRQGEI